MLQYVEVDTSISSLIIDDMNGLVGTVEWSSKEDDTDLDHPIVIVLIVFCVLCVFFVLILIKGQSKK